MSGEMEYGVTAMLDDDGRVVADVYCTACRYNLRGLEVTGRCPECGGAVGGSMAFAVAFRRVTRQVAERVTAAFSLPIGIACMIWAWDQNWVAWSFGLLFAWVGVYGTFVKRELIAGCVLNGVEVRYSLLGGWPIWKRRWPLAEFNAVLRDRREDAEGRATWEVRLCRKAGRPVLVGYFQTAEAADLCAAELGTKTGLRVLSD